MPQMHSYSIEYVHPVYGTKSVEEFSAENRHKALDSFYEWFDSEYLHSYEEDVLVSRTKLV